MSSVVVTDVDQGTVLADLGRLMGQALLGIGMGVAWGIYLCFDKSAETKEKDKLKSELNNTLYNLRKELDDVDAAAGKQLERDMDVAGKLAAEIKAALDQDRKEDIKNVLGALNAKITDLRKKIELAKLSQKEDLLLQEYKPAVPLMDDSQTRLGAPGTETEDTLAPQRPAEVSNSNNSIRTEILRFHALTKAYDEDVYRELLPLVDSVKGETYAQRLSVVKDNIKLRYGKLKEAAAETIAYRNVLNGLIETLRQHPGSGKLAGDIQMLIARKNITREEYETILSCAAELAAREVTVLEIKNRLEALGYHVAVGDDIAGKIENGEVVYLSTKWDGYKIMLRLDPDGKLTTRMVRMVDTEDEKKNITSYQKQKDIDTAKQWCKDYKGFIEKLREVGLTADVKFIKEPEEEGVACIVSAGAAQARAKAAAINGSGAEASMKQS
ncbi:MAG: hypothetical protein EPN22_02570 [Nitrospirae bacterium]|nr:MAG: hypothetical protein EPN22_02570 [Nitrospirota bacterium]